MLQDTSHKINNLAYRALFFLKVDKDGENVESKLNIKCFSAQPNKQQASPTFFGLFHLNMVQNLNAFTLSKECGEMYISINDSLLHG